MEIVTPELEQVHTRLAKLEKDNRGLKLGIVLLGVGMLGLLWIAEKRGRTWIEAEGFVIKDKQAVTRGIFTAIEEDAFITLYGVDGKVRTVMSAAPSGSSLALYNAEGGTAARLHRGPRGTDLYLADAEQKLRVVISSGPKGTRLQLLDGNGKSRITLGEQAGSEKEPPAQKQSDYSLVIADEDGKPLFAAPQPTP